MWKVWTALSIISWRLSQWSQKTLCLAGNCSLPRSDDGKANKTSFIKYVHSTCATTNWVSWQCRKTQMTRPGKSEQLCSNPDYYLLFIHFVLLKLRHADQHKFALPLRVHLKRQNRCLSVGLPHVRVLTIINKAMSVRAGLAAFAKFRSI